ncbi:3190_t:CDS:2, partial [Cetraspora pellucida]
MSSSEENINESTSIITKDKKKSSSHPEGSVWNYFTKGEKIGKERYQATSDPKIIRQFLTKILSNTSEKNIFNKKRKSNIQGNLDQYISIIELDQQKIKRINLAWARAFVI